MSRIGKQPVTVPAGVKLDFGAVGKGWALDRAAETLSDLGVGCALLHGGTSTVLGLRAARRTRSRTSRIAGPSSTRWICRVHRVDSTPGAEQGFGAPGLGCRRTLVDQGVTVARR